MSRRDALIDIAQPRQSLIFRPGTGNSGNVYGDWGQLVGSIADLEGIKLIEIDTSLVSPAVIPAGTYDLDDVILQGRGGPFLTLLTINDGVTFQNLRTIREGLQITSQCNTAPIRDVQNGEFLIFEGSTIITTGTAAFVDYTPTLGQMNIRCLENARLLGGTAPIFNLTNIGGGAAIQLFDRSELGTNSLDGVAGSGMSVDLSGAGATLTQNVAGGTLPGGGTIGVSTLAVPRLNRININSTQTLTGMSAYVRAFATGAPFTITLPPAAGGALDRKPTAGQQIVIKNVEASANVITIDGDGAETIDGAATTTIAANFGAVTLMSDGASAWNIVSRFP